MEIISIVVEGALEHRGSLGIGSVIRPGEVQRMTAGTGVRLSEFNPSEDEEVRFLQIWIEPERSGLAPSYELRGFPLAGRENTWVLVASHDARDGSLTVHQDVSIRRARLTSEGHLEYRPAEGRHAWLQMIDGAVEINGRRLEGGDGAALSEPGALVISGGPDISDILLFDLA